MEIEAGRVYPTAHKKRIAQNVRELKNSLDTSWASHKTAEDYKKHMKDRIEYPTTARLAKHELFDRARKVYDTNIIWRNEQIVLNQDPEAAQLAKALKQKMKKLYPKTRKVREYIIKDDRISLDCIKPAKGFSFFDRIGILLTKIR